MLQLMERAANGAPRERLKDGRVAARLRAVARAVVGAQEVDCHEWDFNAFHKDSEADSVR